MKLRACLILLACPAVAGAEIYKWVDGKGQAHYSQERPQQQKFETYQGKVPQLGNAADMQRMHEMVAGSDKARQEQATAEAAAKKDPAVAAQQCQAARERLARMAERPPEELATREAGGASHSMTEAEYNAEQAAMRRIVAEACH